MSTSFRALVCEQLGSDFQGVRLAQRVLGPLGPNDIHIWVGAAALNFPDLLMTEGKYQYKPEPPFVMGTEGAGKVLACGNAVTRFKPGDAVSFSLRHGAIAEQVVVGQDSAYPIPKGFSLNEAAAWRVGALTAYTALSLRGQLLAGETLLVHGASGGMGMAAVQLGRHLGAKVIATSTSKEKLEVVKAAGAHYGLNLAQGFREQVKALTHGMGADVVFDPVGGDVFDESLRCIQWGGRILIVGFVSGRIAQLPTNIALIKGFSVLGVRAGEEMRRNPDRAKKTVQSIQALADLGVFKPHIGAVYALDNAMDALQALKARSHVGKLVINFE